MTVTWYTLYAFVVGRGWDNEYDDMPSYYFSSYVVLPLGDRHYARASW